MKNLGLFVAILFSLVLSATLLRLPGVALDAPNLVVFGVIMAGMLRGPRVGLTLGLLIGFVEDVNFGVFLGETAFAYAIVGYLAGYVRSLLMRESLLLSLLLTGLGTELFLWTTFGADRLFGEAVISAHAMLQMSTRTTLSSMAVAVPLYFLYHRLFAMKALVRYGDDSTKA